MVRFRFASGSVRIVNFSTGDTVCPESFRLNLQYLNAFKCKYRPRTRCVNRFASVLITIACICVYVRLRTFAIMRFRELACDHINTRVTPLFYLAVHGPYNQCTCKQ